MRDTAPISKLPVPGPDDLQPAVVTGLRRDEGKRIGGERRLGSIRPAPWPFRRPAPRAPRRSRPGRTPRRSDRCRLCPSRRPTPPGRPPPRSRPPEGSTDGECMPVNGVSVSMETVPRWTDDLPGGGLQIVERTRAPVGIRGGSPGGVTISDDEEELAVLQHLRPEPAVHAAAQVLDELTVEILGDRGTPLLHVHGEDARSAEGRRRYDEAQGKREDESSHLMAPVS